jgi:ring-1,2-phenylacetyl-CoA epoxidase subunit PaaD
VVTAVPTRDQVYGWLGEVADPELPALSIVDLGIVREVRVGPGVTVALAPTYSGCPATEVIEQDVVEALARHGVAQVAIERRLSPPWTSDWISAEGREKLRRHGIAPPERAVACPRCNSSNALRVSEFGSTPCKASYRCGDCSEPFEYFKCI